MKYSYRFGTSSYIIPDDILPNVRYLADQVDDVELVLFEVDDGPNNLPNEDTIRELTEIASAHNLSYTVHLPLDIKLGDTTGELDVSLVKAKKVIERTRDLSPFAYVLHLDGRSVLQGAPKQPWDDQAAKSLEILGGWVGDVKKLSVENLETYPQDFWDAVLERVPASRCIDVGHLWLMDMDPIPFLKKHLDRTSVIHIHGIHERDHQSLKYVNTAQLSRVLSHLEKFSYQGVMTMEIFSEDDFLTSLEAIRGAEQLKEGING